MFNPEKKGESLNPALVKKFIIQLYKTGNLSKDEKDELEPLVIFSIIEKHCRRNLLCLIQKRKENF